MHIIRIRLFLNGPHIFSMYFYTLNKFCTTHFFPLRFKSYILCSSSSFFFWPKQCILIIKDTAGIIRLISFVTVTVPVTQFMQDTYVFMHFFFKCSRQCILQVVSHIQTQNNMLFKRKWGIGTVGKKKKREHPIFQQQNRSMKNIRYIQTLDWKLSFLSIYVRKKKLHGRESSAKGNCSRF